MADKEIIKYYSEFPSSICDLGRERRHQPCLLPWSIGYIKPGREDLTPVVLVVTEVENELNLVG